MTEQVNIGEGIQYDADMFRVMDAYHREEERIDLENKRNNERIFKAIASLKGKEFLDSLFLCTQECEVAAWELCREPRGEYQQDEFGVIKGIWVDQWTVGLEGDSFEGYVCVQLKEKLWIKGHYSC